MAEKPYKFTDRRSTSAGWSRFNSTLQGFQDAAKDSIGREQFPMADKDSSALFGRWDRIKLMTVGRYMYARDPIIQGSVDQVSRLTTAIVTPQFDGEDIKWGQTAEDWLYENDRWIDVRGWPYTMNDQDRLIIHHIIQDGDIGELLTEDENGNPKTQLIPAHRIGMRSSVYGGRERVVGGKFDGALIVDGVILGDSFDVLGYRVLGDKKEDDRDFSVNDMRLHFIPKYADQFRGFSHLATAAIGIQDVHESRRLELLAQKLLASTVIVEQNETGGPDPGHANIVVPGNEGSATSESTAPVYGKEINGGETKYFRSGSQSKLEVLTGDRPTVNQREFSAELVRQAIHGIGWSVDYALDPTKAGGAQMRIVVENCNRTLDFLRKVTEKRRKWVDGWRIAKAIKSGWIAASNDWWRWEYQFAARLTADKKYDSEVDINEMVSGVGTQSGACARRGFWWEDVNKQKERELRDKLTRAKSIASEFGLSIQEIMPHLGMLHSNELSAVASLKMSDSKSDQKNTGNE